MRADRKPVPVRGLSLGRGNGTLLSERQVLYNPDPGRFLTRNPYSGESDEPLSQNPYTYVHNNPVNLSDPSGYCPWCVADAFLGAGIKGTLYIMVHRENVTLGGLALAMAIGAALVTNSLIPSKPVSIARSISNARFVGPDRIMTPD